ncbi:MAG: flavodoxin domain-containing protein [Patescibacteria group bacterium]
MAKKILVAYASRCGSTAEIAAAVGEVLRQAGHDVTVESVKRVKDLSPYQAVIIGSAARMFRLLPEAVKFARKNSAALAKVPVAYFMAGMMMKDATPENTAKADAILNKLREVKGPVGTALFAGKFDVATLEQPWRFFMSRNKDKNKEMGEGDFRDWKAIEAWAGEMAGKI